MQNINTTYTLFEVLPICLCIHKNPPPLIVFDILSVRVEYQKQLKIRKIYNYEHREFQKAIF